MWLLFSLLAPLFFGIVHVLDSYCVEDIFEHPWMGMITSALASFIIFLLLPYILPFVQWQWPAWHVIILALIGGALIQYSQGMYFQALSYSEAGIVAAYWNMVPAFIPILSFMILNQRLNLKEYAGISLLTVSSTIFCLIDSNIKSRWKTFLFMLFASLMQAALFLIEDFVYANSGYIEAFYIISTGLILAGCSPLLFKKIRCAFNSQSHNLISTAKFFVFIEIANLIALACSQKAVDLGIPSLTAAVESTIPAYTFVMLILLTKVAPKFGDEEAKNKVVLKFGLIGAMVIGVLFIT